MQDTTTRLRSSRWLSTARLALGLLMLPILLAIALGAALSGQPCGSVLQFSGWIIDGAPKRSAERRA